MFTCESMLIEEDLVYNSSHDACRYVRQNIQPKDRGEGRWMSMIEAPL